MNALSSMVELYSGMPVSPNKPIVGYNVFRHELEFRKCHVKEI